jgi:GNAT superfamily N-acetyltransferase
MGHVEPASLAEALAVLSEVPEFGAQDIARQVPEHPGAGAGTVLVAFSASGVPVGAVIAYDRYHDGSLYAWLAGVVPAARRQGALTALMAGLELQAEAAGYAAIRLSTRNRFRAMLAYLVRDGYIFLDVDQVAPGTSPADYKLRLIKQLR